MKLRAEFSPINMPGYRGRHYYGGYEFVDEVEVLAIERPKKLFNCNFANVQPHSGFQANQTLILALVKLGEKILRISLVAGGHFSGSRIGSPAGTTRGFKNLIG